MAKAPQGTRCSGLQALVESTDLLFPLKLAHLASQAHSGLVQSLGLGIAEEAGSHSSSSSLGLFLWQLQAASV